MLTTSEHLSPSWRERPRPLRLLTGCALLVAAAVAADSTAAAAQTAPAEGSDDPIEWSFHPASDAADGVSLQERWAAPFAVESSGSIAPRGPRPVVVVRDAEAARLAARAQATAGQLPPEEELVAGETDASAEEVLDAPPVTASPERSAPPAARTHRVEYGETWYGLAREYRVSSSELAAANPDVDPERLRAGTVLRLPGPNADVAPRRHTVVRGDTLFGIARRYGVAVAELRAANRITDDVVRLGQTLVIPQVETAR